MAHYAKPLSFLFLILLSFSLHVEAVDRLFFSKVTHNTTKFSTTTAAADSSTNSESLHLAPSPSVSPSPAPAPAPEIETSENNSGYGLYGEESNEFPPAKTTTTTSATTVSPEDEKEIQTEELSQNYEKEETGYTYNNNNGYANNQNSYNANGYTNNYNGENSYVSEKQGMSDTRFMENGKYYYDAKSENKYYSANGYNSETESANSEGYYNGNGENEFDSMEEYERQQGYYQQSQDKYIP